MYKILIIDDEELTRIFLTKIIKENLKKCTIVGEASNSNEAFEKISQLNPDIIITDICLNHTTGLDIIQELRPNAKIIVITGYRDFEYAKQAINLQVSALLTKPINPKDLLNSINSAIMSIETERQQQLETEKLNALLKENLSIIKQNYLLDLLYGRSIRSPEAIKKQLKLCNIEIVNFYVILFDIQPSKELEDITHQLIQCDLLNMFEEYICSTNEYYHIFLNREQLIIILKNDNHMFDYSALNDMGDKIIDRILKKYNYINIYIALSTLGKNISELSVKYKECKKVLSYANQFTKNTTVLFSDIHTLENNTDYNYTLISLRASLMTALDEEDITNINLCVQEIINVSSKIKKYSTDYLHRFYRTIVIYINDIRENISVYDKKHDSNIINIVKLLDDCKSIADFNNILSITIQNLLQNIQIKNEQNISSHIEKAIKYIHQNIQNDLSLDDISKHISLSTAYTCRLFKKQTGQNLTTYITSTKLNEAKKLFDNTDLKIYEVAQAVGINNTNYFSSLFKKHIGISPSEYIQKKQ